MTQDMDIHGYGHRNGHKLKNGRDMDKMDSSKILNSKICTPWKGRCFLKVVFVFIVYYSTVVQNP
jgi:hypothetical protein